MKPSKQYVISLTYYGHVDNKITCSTVGDFLSYTSKLMCFACNTRCSAECIRMQQENITVATFRTKALHSERFDVESRLHIMYICI